MRPALWTVLLMLLAPGALAQYLPPVRQADVDVRIVVNGTELPYRWRRGSQREITGRVGQAYAIRVRNNTGRWIEVVASVDGLDVIDGLREDLYGKRGYVLQPGASYDITGWRRNLSTVEAFRFVPAHASEAARRGRPGRIGQIRVAVYFGSVGAHRPLVPRGYLQNRPMDDLTRSEAPADEDSAGARPKSSRTKKAPRCIGGCYHHHNHHLGTARGEDRYAPASETDFVRDHYRSPDRLVTIYYRGHHHHWRR